MSLSASTASLTYNKAANMLHAAPFTPTNVNTKLIQEIGVTWLRTVTARSDFGRLV